MAPGPAPRRPVAVSAMLLSYQSTEKTGQGDRRSGANVGKGVKDAYLILRRHGPPGPRPGARSSRVPAGRGREPI